MASLLPSFVTSLAGTRSLGGVDRFGGTGVVTRFIHVLGLPVVPLSSRLVLEAPLGGAEVSCPLPLQGRSVLAAYLRGWAPVLSLVMGVAAGLGWAGGTAWDAWTPGFLVGAAVGVLAGLAGWRLGRLGPDACMQRYIYMDLLGYPADAAGLELPGMAARLVESVDAQAQHLAPGTDWLALAQDPATSSVPFLKAAFTRARWEWGRAAGTRRQQLAKVHDALWQRIHPHCTDVWEDVRVMR